MSSRLKNLILLFSKLEFAVATVVFCCNVRCKLVYKGDTVGDWLSWECLYGCSWGHTSFWRSGCKCFKNIIIWNLISMVINSLLKCVLFIPEILNLFYYFEIHFINVLYFFHQQIMIIYLINKHVFALYKILIITKIFKQH